jgi:hypothetical protein
MVSAIQDSSATYNSSTEGFDLNGNKYLVYAQSGSSENVMEWNYGTDSEAAANKNPVMAMSSATFDVMHNGTYDSKTRRFTYNGKTYGIRFLESSGKFWAEAVET